MLLKFGESWLAVAKKTLAETSADDRPDLIRLRFKLVFCFGWTATLHYIANRDRILGGVPPIEINHVVL